MLYRRLGQEGEEMVGPFAKRNAVKDRRMNLLPGAGSKLKALKLEETL